MALLKITSETMVIGIIRNYNTGIVKTVIKRLRIRTVEWNGIIERNYVRVGL